MEYSRILKEIYEEIQPYAQEGKPASYIPELLKVNPDRYGISCCIWLPAQRSYERSWAGLYAGSGRDDTLGHTADSGWCGGMYSV